MTPREEIKFIVEHTPGECWHGVNHLENFILTKQQLSGTMTCKCGEWTPDRIYMNLEGGYLLSCSADRYFRNHDPHDLNALVQLAEKNGYKDIDFYSESGSCTIYPNGRIVGSGRGTGETKADALRKALVEVIEREGAP